MKVEKIAIVAALGGLAYLYLGEETDEEREAREYATCGPLARLRTDVSGNQFCEPKLKCKEGFVLSQDMTQCFDKDNPCGPGFKMDPEGACQITDEACGNRCYKLNAAQDDCIKIPNCGTATGSEIGDMAMYFGQSLVMGYIYDKAISKVGDIASKKLAAEAARVAAKKAGGGAVKLATQVATKKLAGRAAALAATKAAIALATKIARKLAVKVALQLAKIAALSSTGIGILATPFMILSTSLSIGMMASRTFFEVPPGTTGKVHDWDTLPEGAQVAITSLPVIGDAIDMVAPYVYLLEGCQPGLENQNELCYPPAESDFQCESFLCYAKHDRLVGYRAENYLGGTLQHLTKKIIMDTGTIPNNCPPGREHGQGGLFCYDKQTDKPGKIVLGTWQEDCKPGERDDILFCAKEHIDPCPAGSDDIAGTCWGNVGEVCGDNCAAGWDGCKRKVWNPLHCNSYGKETCSWGCHQDNPFKGPCGGCEKKGWDALHCNSWGREECQGGCITTCSPVRGITKELIHRNYRLESRPKELRTLKPHDNICVAPKSENIAGLCYPNSSEMPPGYHRKVIGTLDPGCPGDKDSWRGYQMFNPTQDIGVSCQVATYTRPPFPKISINAKRKVVIEDPPDPPLPPYCADLPVLPETDPKFQQRLCLEKKPPAGYSLSDDGLAFFKTCKDLFWFNFETTNCERINDAGEEEKYPNAEGLIRAEYDFK